MSGTFQPRPRFARFTIAFFAVLLLRITVDWGHFRDPFSVWVLVPLEFVEHYDRFGEQAVFLIGTCILVSLLLLAAPRRGLFVLLTSVTVLASTISVRLLADYIDDSIPSWALVSVIADSVLRYSETGNTIDLISAALLGFTTVVFLTSSWKRAMVWALVFVIAGVGGQEIQAYFGEWPKHFGSVLDRQVLTAACALPFACAVGLMADVFGTRTLE